MNIQKQTLFAGFAILVVAAALISITAVSSRSAELERFTQASTLSVIDDRLNGAVAAINDFPGSAGKDLLFLKTLSRKEDFLSFLDKNDPYRELYVFDNQGACVMEIKRNVFTSSDCGEISEIVHTALDRTKDIRANTVHISPLVMYGDMPSLLYATPLDRGGFIISVINADYFLEEIRRLSRDGESVYLISRDGSYLAHSDHTKEKLFGGESNFYHDFTSVPGGALDNPDMRRFETKSQIFTFWRIYPSISNFAIYEGSSVLYGKEHADEDYWIMAAVSEKLKIGAWWQDLSYITVISLIIFLHLLLIVLAYVITHRNKGIPYE